MSEIVSLGKETFTEFQRHKAQWLAAAIAYFTMFAVAPLIIVVVEILGFVLGQHHDTLQMLYGYLQQTAGKDAAAGIQGIVAATFAQQHQSGLLQIVSWVVFVLAAIGLFSALQGAINTIWDVTPQKGGIWTMLWGRFLSFGVVLLCSFVALVLVVVTSALNVASQALVQVAPFFPTLVQVLDFILSGIVITGLLAVIFEYLPDCRVEWKDVWTGAAVSALLFVIGQFLLSWYLGRAGISSTYGAFGGLVVFLVWVNYSSQIILFGAEFTHVYARRRERGGTAGPPQAVQTVKESSVASRMR